MSRGHQSSLSDLASQLISHIRPDLQPTSSGFANERDHVLREVRSDRGTGPRKEWEDVRASIRGLASAARIKVQEDLGDALDRVVEDLAMRRSRGQQDWQGDMPIQMSNLPQHIHLLLLLSSRPTAETHALARAYLAPPPAAAGPTPEQQLYNEIMAEPFSGAHWQRGYDEEVRDGWTESSDGESESEASDEIVTPLKGVAGTALGKREMARLEEARLREEQEERLRRAGEILKGMREGRYWADGGGRREVGREVRKGEGWREVTMNTTTCALAAACSGKPVAEDTKVISAEQLQRELLFALSGRPGIMLYHPSADTCRIVSDHPQVRHFSPAALDGVLQSVQHLATHAATLRSSALTTLSPASPPSTSSAPHTLPPQPSKTTQAFAEACRKVVRGFDAWLAEQEAAFTRVSSSSPAPETSTPLTLLSQIDERFASTLQYLASLVPFAHAPIRLLDALYTTVTLALSTEDETRDSLLRVFTSTAEPMWKMLGEWLCNGMPVPRSLTSSSLDLDFEAEDDERELDAEFFIRRDRDVSWGDEDFWEAGYVMRGSDGQADQQEGWPAWLDETGLRETILEGGKARGLLRSLALDEDDEDSREAWRPLSQILGGREPGEEVATCIARCIEPIARIAQVKLRRVMEEDCGLVQHLEALEGLFYGRGCAVFNDWTAWLFDQMRKGKKWADFQVLTGTFRDRVERRGEGWMNASALQVRYKGKSPAGDSLAPSTLSGLTASYQMPFPLSQLFSPTSLALRAEAFTFLVQVQHARRLLVESRRRKEMGSAVLRARGDLKQAWAARQRLMWVVDCSTVWTWITGRIIEVQVAAYREQLAGTSSFGAMIALELQHTRMIRDFCFANEHTSDLHNAVMRILDLSTRTFAGSTAMQQRHGKPIARRRRERSAASETDESETDLDADEPELPPVEADTTMGDTGDLEGLVGYLRGEVERLSLEGPEEQREGWAMLDFALRDWR